MTPTTNQPDHGIDPLKLAALAQAAHEANRAYCNAIGDPSQVAWEIAPEWQRTSAVSGAIGVLRGAGAGASHLSWMLDKLADGWKYGAVKDPMAKTHPCMVHFTELPAEQQAKDHLFVATVRAMAAALGLPVASNPPLDLLARVDGKILEVGDYDNRGPHIQLGLNGLDPRVQATLPIDEPTARRCAVHLYEKVEITLRLVDTSPQKNKGEPEAAP